MTPADQAAIGESTKAAAEFVTKFNDVILFPTIALLSGVALLVFIWGCAKYIMNADNETERENGKKHILLGLIGLFIMVSAYAILTFAVNSFGLKGQLDCVEDPSATGCAEKFKLPSTKNVGGEKLIP